MAKWRAERPDIDCSGKAIVGRLLHMHDLILKAVNRTLAEHGLKYPVYAVLATLRVEGEPYSLSPGVLSETLLLTSGGLSNLLRRMEERGLVVRTSDQHDGRSVAVALTPKGLALVDAAMPDHAETERRIVAMLAPADQKAMADMLAAVVATNR
jgi:DNA-binding MarR family transcriptional regulator